MSTIKQDARQQAIIKAAIHAFKEKGFEGARVDQIAAAAGVNKATLYYRVGDKAALYEMVLDFILHDAADEIEANLNSENTPIQLLQRHIHILATTTEQFAPIMLRELAAGGQTVPDVALRHMGRVVAALRTILQRGVKTGLFRNSNPFITHMMIVGGLSIYATNQPLRQRSAKQHPEDYQAEHFISQQQAADEICDQLIASLTHRQHPTGNSQ